MLISCPFSVIIHLPRAFWILDFMGMSESNAVLTGTTRAARAATPAPLVTVAVEMHAVKRAGGAGRPLLCPQGQGEGVLIGVFLLSVVMQTMLMLVIATQKFPRLQIGNLLTEASTIRSPQC